MNMEKRTSMGLFSFVALIILLFSINAISSTQPISLITVIETCPYNISDYEEDVFDCSNMADYQYDWLESHGYNPVFVVGELSSYDTWHVWIEVNDTWVESTTKEIIVTRSEYIPLFKFNKFSKEYYEYEGEWCY